jgi:hypothetical protein
MIKKKSQAKHLSHNKTHILVKKSIASYAVLVFVLFFMTALAGHAIYGLAIARSNNDRLERIQSVYTTINLDDSYRIAKSDLFGDKRVYTWDPSRTYSSSMEYGHNDTQANTFADLKTKIEKAGYHFTGQVYDGIAKQYHFKSDNNEYVRVQVLPHAYKDAMTYGVPTLEQLTTSDITASPVYVTIKVNLDDNNE